MTPVQIYTTPTCTYCKMAKEYFKENQIQFEEFNVAEDEVKRNEMVEMTGQLGVPVININNKIIIGFDKDTVEKALKA